MSDFKKSSKSDEQNFYLSKKNEWGDDLSVESLLSEIGMTAEEFENEFGVSIEEFEDEVGMSVNDLLGELDLLSDEESKMDVNTDNLEFIQEKSDEVNGNVNQVTNKVVSQSKNKILDNKLKETYGEYVDQESITDGIKAARHFFKENKLSDQEDTEVIELRTIAVACELAPAKTIIPVLQRLKELENEGKLNWKKTKIIGLAHGEGADELLEPYCDYVYYIGQGRRANTSNKNDIQLSGLIIKDIFKAIKAMMGEQIDLLITCGNAGDVRKSISAAKLLRTPVLHIEQDIYNPIELISQSNLITVPSKDYELYLKIQYGLKNVVSIGGYPMATYVNNQISTKKLKSKDDIRKRYGFENYIFVLLGGDLKKEDLKDLIPLIDGLDYPTLIAPYRFDRKYVEMLSKSPKVKIIENNVDVISLTNSADALIYGAGMGMTIEAGVLKVPAIKIYGFHLFHSSINLAKELNIPIVQIWDIPRALRKLYPASGDIVSDSDIAIDNLINIINHFDFSLKKGNLRNTWKIWRARSKFRKSSN